MQDQKSRQRTIRMVFRGGSCELEELRLWGRRPARDRKLNIAFTKTWAEFEKQFVLVHKRESSKINANLPSRKLSVVSIHVTGPDPDADNTDNRLGARSQPCQLDGWHPQN